MRLLVIFFIIIVSNRFNFAVSDFTVELVISFELFSVMIGFFLLRTPGRVALPWLTGI